MLPGIRARRPRHFVHLVSVSEFVHLFSEEVHEDWMMLILAGASPPESESVFWCCKSARLPLGRGCHDFGSTPMSEQGMWS